MGLSENYFKDILSDVATAEEYFEDGDINRTTEAMQVILTEVEDCLLELTEFKE